MILKSAGMIIFWDSFTDTAVLCDRNIRRVEEEREVVWMTGGFYGYGCYEARRLEWIESRG